MASNEVSVIVPSAAVSLGEEALLQLDVLDAVSMSEDGQQVKVDIETDWQS